MSTYILVHGGSRDGTLWDPVASLLRQKAHNVYCPSLPNPIHSSLTEHIDTVCRVFTDHDLKNVRLIGHSYGGVVITGVADRMYERIEKLIYVDSTIPKSGESLFTAIEATGNKPIEKYSLDPDPPFVEPVQYDIERWAHLPKHYIWCTEGEFIDVTKPTIERVVARSAQEKWVLHSIQSKHAVMLTKPFELTQLFLDIG